ncbi:MAG: HEAT repeat domain-containing protein [Thermomicrobia bacterium]|nr:HEAT repeat domain-containing protein [Thermomicrobia bacterium]
MRTSLAVPARNAVAPHRFAGSVLTVGGVIADGAVGVAILRGATPWALCVHLLAALVWAQGLSLREGFSLSSLVHRWRARGAGMDAAGNAAGSPLNGRTIAFSLIGLLLFPGLGTLGITVAAGISSVRMMAHRQRALPAFDAAPTVPWNRPSDPLRDLAIEPLVDILRDPDHPMRHAAVRLLGRRCDRESVTLLRGLLTDPDPDLRGEASTTLFNFEDKLNRALTVARAHAEGDPQHAAPHAALAAAYRAFVQCGLLDGPSANLYLARACTALQEATALDPERTDYWIALADVQNGLGATAAASRAVAHALALSPDNSEARLLAMTLAFREERWSDMLTLSATAKRSAPEHADLRELLDWWDAPARAQTAAGGAA